MEIINITPIIWKEDDAYISKCSELEIASVGNSPQESLENLREAVELYVGNAKAGNMNDKQRKWSVRSLLIWKTPET